ncbi:hypothetical protein RHGRI_016200 [Rhododendron griersonianum]|uniref:Uncharacterized protein n=1 Tax=Rhododendron griersonianum TaxID=479676 RepID=A0AAV6JSK0_9ERIC|nr:hypothetical protein RHGRI_016200 [Rhododendron griersonianum]
MVQTEFYSGLASILARDKNGARCTAHITRFINVLYFYWDNVRMTYHAKTGIYVTHLSQKSPYVILNQLMYAATCLRPVEVVVNKEEIAVRLPSPTLRAFSFSVSAWLKHDGRCILFENFLVFGAEITRCSLEGEVSISNSNGEASPTLLGLASSLSRFVQLAIRPKFSAFEKFFLAWQGLPASSLLRCRLFTVIVHGAIPKVHLETDSCVPASEIAVHILDYLYTNLNEICPVQGGEVVKFPGLHMFSFLLFCMLFYANEAVSVNEADFWEKSYLLRQRHHGIFKVAGTTAGISTNDKKEMAGRESISVSSPIKGNDLINRDIQFGESGHLRSQDDTKMLEVLFPFPTLLPPLQVDYVGRNILLKLLYEWRPMDELGVLHLALHLPHPGDLLQHFLNVIFDQLDKKESWDDDFELNMILQPSEFSALFALCRFSFKLNVRHFPHLAELVTRINYDYFYMPDNGNLITAPGSETASLLRWGKPSLFEQIDHICSPVLCYIFLDRIITTTYWKRK